MGQQISRVYGALVKRPLQRYNVDHRAANVIAKIEDPKAPAMRAPMYESDKGLLDKIRESNPTLAESTLRKDNELHSRLRDVFVTSNDPEIQQVSKETAENPSRTLPSDRSQYSYEFIPASMRMDRNRKIPRGKATIEQVVSFLSDHAGKPDVHSVEAISNLYRLNPTATANTLKYVKIFKAHVPEEKVKKEFDPLQAGKDWVEDVKDEQSKLFLYNQERDKRLKLLKAQEDKKKSQQQQELLSDGARTKK